MSEPVGHAFVSMAATTATSRRASPTARWAPTPSRRDTGLVIQDHSLCIGCKTCIEACPFHAPAYDEVTSTTFKCDAASTAARRGCLRVHRGVPEREHLPGRVRTVLSGHAGAVSVKDVSETHPNLAVTLDPDITVEAFADIDGMAETVDRGGEGY